MSYDVSAFYVTETHLKNRIKTDVKPGGGILSGGNGPGYQTNDSQPCAGTERLALRCVRAPWSGRQMHTKPPLHWGFWAMPTSNRAISPPRTCLCITLHAG